MIIIPSNTSSIKITTYTDDFNRADSSAGLGSNWTNFSGTVGISGNAAYLAANGAWYGAYAYYNTPFDRGEMEVSVKYVQSGDYLAPVIGSPSVGWVLGLARPDYAAIYFMNAGGSSVDIKASEPLSGSSRPAVGDRILLKRTGNVFQIFKVGNATALASYTDSANERPLASCLYAGCGVTAATRIDDWQANTF